MVKVLSFPPIIAQRKGFTPFVKSAFSIWVLLSGVSNCKVIFSETIIILPLQTLQDFSAGLRLCRGILQYNMQ